MLTRIKLSECLELLPEDPMMNGIILAHDAEQRAEIERLKKEIIAVCLQRNNLHVELVEAQNDNKRLKKIEDALNGENEKLRAPTFHTTVVGSSSDYMAVDMSDATTKRVVELQAALDEIEKIAIQDLVGFDAGRRISQIIRRVKGKKKPK